MTRSAKYSTTRAIATVLNREQIKTDDGTIGRDVECLPSATNSRIPAHSAQAQETNGWITQEQAATRLDISPMSVTRFVRAGIIPAEQPHPRLPTVINHDMLQLEQVKNAVLTLKHSRNRPLSHDPDQLSSLRRNRFLKGCIMSARFWRAR